METIKLNGNTFPVAEPPLVEHAKNVEQSKSPLAEQVEDQEPDCQVDYQGDFEHPLKEIESEEEKNEKRTLIRKIMRYRSTFPTELLDLSHKN